MDLCIPGTTFLPTEEKSEASPSPSPLAGSDPEDMAAGLSQEVQDSFSFLEDSSSSEPEWVGAEDGAAVQAGTAAAAFSPGEDEPGMSYLEELLGAGPQVRRSWAGLAGGRLGEAGPAGPQTVLCPQVEEFSVEPPLDDLSLDEAQFVLAPSCCPLDSAGPGPEAEEENGEEVFLSAYDDLSPLLGAKTLAWEGPGSPEDEAAGCRTQEAPGRAEGRPAQGAVGDDKEAEPGSRWDIREEAEGSPERELEAAEAGEDGGGAGGSQEVMVSSSGKGMEAMGEESKGQQEEESLEEAKGVEDTGGEQGKHQEERKTEREEESEEGQEAQVEAGKDPELEAPEDRAADESQGAGHKQEAEGGREDEHEVKGQRENGDQGAREDKGDGEDSRSAEDSAEGGAGQVSKERESGDGEAEGDQMAGGEHLEDDFLFEVSCGESLEVDGAKEGNAQPSEMERAALQPPRLEDMEPEGQPSPEGCSLWPCLLGPAGGVSMRLAATLVQVQQVRSVPVVPPKPQFAKMPSAMCSKIHVAPANPCPRPGRLDGTPGERAWGSRASRTSWRNGGSLSFDAAVALARDRQRTEAQGVRRTQTCTGGEDYSLLPRTSPCSVSPAHSPRPLSCLELPSEGTEGSGPRSRSRLSLPPREAQPPHPLLPPQRRTYAFETQANPEKGEGL